MQGAWGWGPFNPHLSKAPSKPWRGQWESHDYGEASGWESGSWDQLGAGDNSHYEEFENVMRWDDSGAQEALEAATKIQERSIKGCKITDSLPSPDLYIQSIDWDSREDLKLPDSAENFEGGEKIRQQKRGRKSGYFRRQFDRQEFSSTADQKQSGDPVHFYETKPPGDLVASVGTRKAPVLEGPSYSSQRNGLSCPLQSSAQDSSRRGNWGSRWSPQPQQQRQNFTNNWQDYRRGTWDERPNFQAHQSGHRGWHPPAIPPEPGKGWGRGGLPHQSPHDLSNDPGRQSTLAGHRNQWICQSEAHAQGFRRQATQQFNRGSKEENYATTVPSQNNHRWRQQRPPPHNPWQ